MTTDAASKVKAAGFGGGAGQVPISPNYRNLPASAVLDWIAAVIRTDQPSLHQWAKAAGVPHPVLYRFRSGQHKTISAGNLAKLAGATRVPCPISMAMNGR